MSIRYLKEVEHYRRKIGEMEKSHREALKKKDQDFERWIVSKEKHMQDEIDRRKNAEKKLEESTIENLDEMKSLQQQNAKVGEELVRKSTMVPPLTTCWYLV